MKIGSPPGRGPARQQLAVPRLVVLALEVDLPLPQQRHDDLERLLEAAHPVIEGVAEGLVLRLVPARAQAQHRRARR